MIITDTSLDGVFLIDIAKREDSRGFFARTWDADMARKHALQERFDYTCVSTNIAVHTLRGMHYQKPPYGEVKLVRCTKGVIFDVAVDLRPDSPTFKQWYGTELSSENHRALYIPAGFAHGFLSLTPDAEVLYHIAGAYSQEASAGVRWNDAAFGIQWPAEPAVIVERDAQYPDFA